LKAIKYLRDDGFELQDIVVLAGRWGNSVISNCSDPWLRKHLAKEEGTKPHKNRIRYSTVHAFKGLEAPAVILMDIDNAGSPEFDAVLYVGLTRPTDRLTVISTREALQDRALKI
jgi:superfamily I DNA/RNA helicase